MADLKVNDNEDSCKTKVLFMNEADGAIEPDNAQLTQVRGFPNTHTLNDIAREVVTPSITNR